MLEATFTKALIVISLTSLRDSRFAAARDTANAGLAQEFDMRWHARVLHLLCTLCQRIPPAHFALNTAYRLLLRYRGRYLRRERASWKRQRHIAPPRLAIQCVWLHGLTARIMGCGIYWCVSAGRSAVERPAGMARVVSGCLMPPETLRLDVAACNQIRTQCFVCQHAP